MSNHVGVVGFVNKKRMKGMVRTMLQIEVALAP